MYRVSVKNSAIDANQAVADLADRGRVIECDSRADAESLAARHGTAGAPIRIQNAAPQDPADVDGYLISDPERYIAEPKDTDTPGLTFDVGPNQYGELGEALVCGSYGLSRGLKHYVYEDLDGVNEESHRIRAITDPDLPDDKASGVSWSPDCEIRVYPQKDIRLVQQYFAEVKAGGGSFERNQVSGMGAVARDYDVLKIRLVLKDLPDEYTLRINHVNPD